MKTRSSYRKQLERLEAHVQALGQGVVDDVRDTGFAIAEGNTSAAEEVIEGHRASERLHRTIEDACMNMMLLQSPVASDLRLITATFRVIGDLARIDEMAYETALLIEEGEHFGSSDLVKKFSIFLNGYECFGHKACLCHGTVAYHDGDAVGSILPAHLLPYHRFIEESCQ